MPHHPHNQQTSSATSPPNPDALNQHKPNQLNSYLGKTQSALDLAGKAFALLEKISEGADSEPK
jgi:hypothetical protein